MLGCWMLESQNGLEVRDQRSEVRERKAEVGDQTLDGQRQRSEVTGQLDSNQPFGCSAMEISRGIAVIGAPLVSAFEQPLTLARPFDFR